MNAALVEGCRNALQMGVALLLQSGLLLLLGLMAGWLLRRRGPELRAFVSQMTLAGVALGAVLSVTLSGHVQPVWGVRLGTPRPMGTPPSRLGSPPPPAGEDGRSDGQGAGPIRQFQSAVLPPAPRNGPLLAKPRQRGEEVASLSETEGSPLPEGSLALLWPAVTGLLLLWLLACQGHLTRLRRAASPVTAGPAAEALAHLSALRRVRAPLLLQSQHVRSPFLAGLRRPAIFFPSTWEADYDDATLRAVLAHELAHLTRRDCTWTLLLRLTMALLWPQPLLWLLARQLDQATEEACDLLAVSPDCPPRRYADCLLRLAERALPGPAARTLGAGVVPIRSALGRRIQRLLDRKGLIGQPIPVRSRQIIAVGVGLLVLGAGVAFVPCLTIADFSWAKAQGWDVQPVRVVRLEPKLLRAFEPLPPNLSSQDAAVAHMCWLNGYPPSAATAIAQRQFYERLAARYPNSFCPKHCLAIWYEGRHQWAQSWYWEQQALRQAPQILAGRIAYPDGKPVANATCRIELYAYEPNNFESRRPISYDWETVTDQEGCYYLPVYKGLYTIPYSPGFFGPAVADAAGKPLNAYFEGGKTTDANDVVPFEPLKVGKQTMGMAATSHVGVLPTIIARSAIQITSPALTQDADLRHPIIIPGSVLHLSWKPVPGAVRYTVSLMEQQADGRSYVPMTPPEEHFQQGGSPETELTLPLNGTDLSRESSTPLFNRAGMYTLSIEAWRSYRPGNWTDMIDTSGVCCFHPSGGFAPQPLSPTTFAQALGGDVTVTSIKIAGKLVTVSGTASNKTILHLDGGNGIGDVGRRFGLTFTSGSFGGPGPTQPEPFSAVFQR